LFLGAHLLSVYSNQREPEEKTASIATAFEASSASPIHYPHEWKGAIQLTGDTIQVTNDGAYSSLGTAMR
jgi:hypothetical protein